MGAISGCPCCGGVIEMRHVGGGARSTNGKFQDFTIWLFSCKPCGLQRRIEQNHEHGANGEVAAIAAWNTRAPLAAAPGGNVCSGSEGTEDATHVLAFYRGLVARYDGQASRPIEVARIELVLGHIAQLERTLRPAGGVEVTEAVRKAVAIIMSAPTYDNRGGRMVKAEGGTGYFCRSDHMGDINVLLTAALGGPT